MALLGVIVGVSCQGSHYQSPHQAAILSDTRYLAGDGTFGAAYSQEDGVEFKEESDVEGNRRGSYSYVDPTGQRHTVTYTAGKNGFQVRKVRVPSLKSLIGAAALISLKTWLAIGERELRRLNHRIDHRKNAGRLKRIYEISKPVVDFTDII